MQGARAMVTMFTATSLDRYRASLKRVEVLDAEAERELAERWSDGDQAAGARLIESSLPFVIAIAREYRRWGVPLEDLVQQGNLGLLKAAAKFDHRMPATDRVSVEPDAGRDDSVGVGGGLEDDRRQGPKEVEGVVGRPQERTCGDPFFGDHPEIRDPGSRIVAVGQPKGPTAWHVRAADRIPKRTDTVTGDPPVEKQRASGG